MTIVLDRSSNGTLTRTFNVVCIKDVEVEVEERVALDGTLLPLVLGYRDAFKLYFRYLSDDDYSFLTQFIRSDYQRIQYESTWYSVRAKEKRLFKSDRSGVEINLVGTQLN